MFLLMFRKQFLIEFLGALGAKKIEWFEETETSIYGTAIYDLDDPEETQEFVWHIQENQVPSEEVLLLAELLHKQELLDIDKIKISINELKKLYIQKQGYIIPDNKFLEILETLKSVEVSMIDEGKETDIFFIHE